MAVTKAKKKEILDQLEAILKGADSVVFVRFHKLSVEETTKIRRSLKTLGLRYVVAKKSLLKLALSHQRIEGDIPELAGEVAICYTDGVADTLAPSREIYAFQKRLVDMFTIIGGVFDDKYKNLEEMTSIATIPGLDVLRGMFVNVINSPIQRFVIGLGAIADKRT